MFAPGHLGERTRIAPFEMVDAVLAECGAVEKRIRRLPARVVVYVLLAAGLFEKCGYPAVWRKLTGALSRSSVPRVTATTLWHARCRLGTRPMRALFDLLRGPASTIRTAGARWAGMLVVAVDGTHLDVADAEAVRAKLGKGANQYTSASGYPQVLLVALVACGTRAVIDAVFGPGKPGESILGRRLTRSMQPDMLVLLDSGFATTGFLNATAASGAHFLARLSTHWKPPVLAHYPDGSLLSRIAGIEVRIAACEITITTSQGHRTGVYRLATTLLDPRQHPAFELVKLYHERWEVESTYYEIKKTMLGRHVLRSRTWPGITQEIYALLSTYQLIRIAISDVAHATGTDPDRCSFTAALNMARDQVSRAANVTAGTVIDLVGAIGRAVIDRPMPNRRLRLSPRAVKRPLSRYAHKSLKVDRRTLKATTSINILTTPISP
ncbi:IS4 family transposase [Streptomyces sp. NBC_01619]|uniref:IS4 family transposase n=1 Tax=Streptomyces sp. NBC_01619 TaxID=2975901 RepID=UPI0022550648|nr:IS4 family transposase [Streptomyces sp. NBC_01619]MCX4515751.1 IS4 family transposase [Streptomyces sp. NBC_01619]